MQFSRTKKDDPQPLPPVPPTPQQIAANCTVVTLKPHCDPRVTSV